MTSPPRSFDETPGGGRIPEGLRRTVLKALSKEPSERQNSAGQFYTEFVASIGNATSLAPKAPAPNPNKTEAMPQPPLAMAPTEGMPITPAAVPAIPSPAIPSPPVALPPAPAQKESAGNRGLIYGLSGVGAVLLVAMGVVALTSDRGGDDPPPVALGPTPSSSGESPSGESPSSAAQPEAPSPAVEEPAPAPEPAPETAPSAPKPASNKPSGSTKPASTKPATPAATPAAPTSPAPTSPAPTSPAPSPAPSSTTAPSAPATQAPAPQPTPPVAAPQPPAPAPASPPKPAAPAADPCAECVRAAAGKDIVAASRAYARCTNPASKQACSTRVQQQAPKIAENAAFRQQCDQARMIIAAATQMGVPEARMAKASAACK